MAEEANDVRSRDSQQGAQFPQKLARATALATGSAPAAVQLEVCARAITDCTGGTIYQDVPR